MEDLLDSKKQEEKNKQFRQELDERIKELKQTLDEKIANADSVTIVPHNRADFDAIGSAITLYILALKAKKKVNILIDDSFHELDPGVQTIINEIETKGFEIISYSDYKKSADEGNLLILTDTSKYNLIPVERDVIDKKVSDGRIVVIDHHASGDTTINSDDTFIFTEYSSTCEVLTKLLCQARIKFDSDIATYLYAGIYLDSNKLRKKYPANETFKWVHKLVENDADTDKVNELFIEDYYSDCKVQDLVINRMNMFTYTIGCVIGEDNKRYTPEELAKAADHILKYKVDASFAVGNIGNNVVSISARSKGKINAGEIMRQLNGGGNVHSAATKLTDETPSEVGKRLLKTLKPEFYVEEQ